MSSWTPPCFYNSEAWALYACSLIWDQLDGLLQAGYSISADGLYENEDKFYDLNWNGNFYFGLPDLDLHIYKHNILHVYL